LRIRHAGSLDARLHHHLLRARLCLRSGLPQAEVVPMTLVTIVVLVLAVLLLGYLTATLLYPEKF
jgi:K+-transporting ATPase KdpF subunit